MKKIQITASIISLSISLVAPVICHADFGVRVGASFNVNADFSHGSVQNPNATNPGTDPAGGYIVQDRFYDDGFNRVDSANNALPFGVTLPGGVTGGATSFWGYQDNTQVDVGAGTVAMNSTTTTLDAGGFSESQDGALPTVELYWDGELVQGDVWTLGFSTGLRWQSVEVDGSDAFGSTAVTITDTFSFPVGGGAVIDPGTLQPVEPYQGTAGPGPLLGDNPSRAVAVASPVVNSKREIDADLFAFNLGPTATVKLTDRCAAAFSGGATLGYMDSKFSYDDGAAGRGSANDNEWLIGAYLGLDVVYQVDEMWFVSLGGTYTYLEDFEQDADGREASVEFDESFILRIGVGASF